jgi:hypothetical protein
VKLWELTKSKKQRSDLFADSCQFYQGRKSGGDHFVAVNHATHSRSVSMDSDSASPDPKGFKKTTSAFAIWKLHI